MTTSRRYASPPDLNQLMADPLVREELARAWSESNPDAPEVPKGQPGSVKCEQGGFIYWNQDTGELEVERLPSGTRDGLGGEPAFGSCIGMRVKTANEFTQFRFGIVKYRSAGLGFAVFSGTRVTSFRRTKASGRFRTTSPRRQHDTPNRT